MVFQIPGGVVEENCELITFIQNIETKEVVAVNKLKLTDPITDIYNAKHEIISNSYNLQQNYPNPFNPQTVISYSIPLKSKVTLKIYDLLGNVIVTLVNKEQDNGNYKIDFSAKGGSAYGGNAYSLASGIYFYKLQAGEFVETKKMILLK